MLRGSASHGHMNSERWVAAYESAARTAGGPAPAGRRAATRSNARGSGQAPVGLHRVAARHPSERRQGRRLADRPDAGACQGAATDLDHEPVEGRPAGQGLRDLVAEREAAFDRESVLVALAGERKRAFVERMPEQMVGRVAGDSRLAGAHGHPRVELLQPGQHDGIGVDGDEHLQDAPAGCRDDGRGEGGVPATRDR